MPNPLLKRQSGKPLSTEKSDVAIEIGASIIVKGIVQGVGFRYYARHHAFHLHLNGYAKNLVNGDVETHVEGEKGMIEEYIKILRIGPPASRVTGVQVDWQPTTGQYKNFNIRF